MIEIVKKPLLGFKMVRLPRAKNFTALCLLEIPKGAKMNRSNIKSRSSSAKVLAILPAKKHKAKVKVAYSGIYRGFFVREYKVNTIVHPEYPFCNKPAECESGIHFCLDKENPVHHIANNNFDQCEYTHVRYALNKHARTIARYEKKYNA